MANIITLVPHDPNWVRQFEAEAGKITALYGPEVIIVHHIGSTAIPDIQARPIIDILVEVRQIEKIDALNALMEKLGYQVVGEHGIRGGGSSSGMKKTSARITSLCFRPVTPRSSTAWISAIT